MNEEEFQKVKFLLELAIDKLVGITGVQDYSDFILRYKLTYDHAVALMDEVTLIEDQIKQDKGVADNEILKRINKFNTQTTVTPYTFTREALQILSPEKLLKMYSSDSP